MFEFITGKVVEKTPTYVVLENNNTGYYINISLNTYSGIGDSELITLYTHPVIREDAHILYGFADRFERSVFRKLISVSGVGANTARMILSSLTPDEVQKAVNEGDVYTLKSIKGIGSKSAQRIIVDLKDKIAGASEIDQILKAESNTIREESLTALVNLGFSKSSVEKVLDSILKEKTKPVVEELIREALKKL